MQVECSSPRRPARLVWTAFLRMCFKCARTHTEPNRPNERTDRQVHRVGRRRCTTRADDWTMTRLRLSWSLKLRAAQGNHRCQSNPTQSRRTHVACIHTRMVCVRCNCVTDRFCLLRVPSLSTFDHHHHQSPTALPLFQSIHSLLFSNLFHSSLVSLYFVLWRSTSFVFSKCLSVSQNVSSSLRWLPCLARHSSCVRCVVKPHTVRPFTSSYTRHLVVHTPYRPHRPALLQWFRES
jgi:hypothetical protein